MATLEIPTRIDGTVYYELEVSLEGDSYILSFDFNERDEKWYLSIKTANDQTHIIDSACVVANWDILRKVRNTRRPPGNIIAVSDVGDPSLTNLGTDVKLVYVEAV